MGFGKWLLGGVCAVGAVVAAPVLLPAAGLAIAAAPATGAIGLSVGSAMMGVSAGTAAAVAGAAGVAAGAIQEKKQEEAYDRGKKDGTASTSKEYEGKFRDQEQAFNAKAKEDVEKINNLAEMLNMYKEKEKLTQEEIKERDRLIDELLESIKNLEGKPSGEDSNTVALVSECISDARNLIATFE